MPKRCLVTPRTKAFRVLESLLDDAQKHPVGDLHLVVDLWVSWGKEMIFDPEFYTEFSELGSVELLVVVGDKHLGNPELAHN